MLLHLSLSSLAQREGLLHSVGLLAERRPCETPPQLSVTFIANFNLDKN